MSIESSEENPFFTKLYKRVEGLLAIMVTDADGNLRLKTVKDGSEFDSSFPASFLLANEHANKLSFGKCKMISVFYKKFVVLQLIEVVDTKFMQQASHKELFFTLIAKRNSNVQKLKSLIPEMTECISELLIQ